MCGGFQSGSTQSRRKTVEDLEIIPVRMAAVESLKQEVD